MVVKMAYFLDHNAFFLDAPIIAQPIEKLQGGGNYWVLGIGRWVFASAVVCPFRHLRTRKKGVDAIVLIV